MVKNISLSLQYHLCLRSDVKPSTVTLAASKISQFEADPSEVAEEYDPGENSLSKYVILNQIFNVDIHLDYRLSDTRYSNTV